MTIKLISPEQHAELLAAYDNKELFLQNKGYEYIVKEKLSDSAKELLAKVETILKDHIIGFSSFSNFRHNKAGEIQLRIQYNYSGDGSGVYFIGVGYILLDELLNGFNEA